VIGRGRRLGALLVVCAVAAAPASAQSRVELSAGASWIGGFDAGGGDALETRNPTTGSSPLPLFSTSSRVEAAPSWTASVGFYLTDRVAVEASAEYSRPVLRTTISGDFEGATGTTAETTLKSLVAGGTLLYYFGAARVTPLAFAGAGWTRQLDEDNIMLVSGAEAHAGGGIRCRLDRHFAVRVDAGVSAREKTIAFDQKRRLLPRVAGSLAYRW